MTLRRKAFQAALGVLALAFAASATYACFMRSLQPVQVWLDHIEVVVKDQVAVKTYDCTFKNLNAVPVTGAECFMELEPGAQVDNMRVDVNGKVMEAEILDVKKANEVFNDIVKRGGSPALLEYYGNQLIRTKVPQIPGQRPGEGQAAIHHRAGEPRRTGPHADAQHQPQGQHAAAAKRQREGQDHLHQAADQERLFADPFDQDRGG